MLLLGLVGELQSLNPDVQRNLRCLWAGSGEKEVNKKFDKEHKTYSVVFLFLLQQLFIQQYDQHLLRLSLQAGTCS